jgi:hypothetical protein
VQSDATTAEEYLAELPDDRRETVEAVRRLILEHLPAGYEETVQFGMLSYVVPLERYPDTYNGQALGYVALANQKQYVSLYLMGAYGDAEERFRTAFEATGKKLDMGKSCVRFKRVDDLALDVVASEIGRVPVEDFLAQYEAARAGTKGGARKRR